MRLKQYGLVLESLRPAYLELLRNWRNDPAIYRHMEFQEHITPDMQSQWFEKVHNLAHYYFIILDNDQAVGLIHLSEVNDQSAQAGLFIGKPEYWGSTVPIRASLCVLHFAFNSLYLHEVTAKVKKDNLTALQYNIALGFKSWKEAQHSDFHWMRVQTEGFNTSTSSLKKAAALLGDSSFQILFEADILLDFMIQNDLQRRRATPGENSSR